MEMRLTISRHGQVFLLPCHIAAGQNINIFDPGFAQLFGSRFRATPAPAADNDGIIFVFNDAITR